uniref:NADH-ubiquinone oxidoreductase chain 6 n=1 Tax=Tetraphleps aterrimus TaxID=452413 RepID=A0A4D6P2G3_9HEMI|nr:NADH dehydrogenase subunit 6 [Tetraphleps aterrimus]QCE31845.1 NADH dehydrogenase subunit 6 [Tetraphleps aterrimus]
MMMILSVMMLWMKHPLSMGLMLIMQTVISAMISGSMMNSFWTSYMLFIVMMSGSLVLFIYMSSIASNEKFNTNMKMMTTTPILMVMTLIIMIKKEDIANNNKMMLTETKTMMYEQTKMMMNMFSNQSMMMTIMMVLYLLITMIVVTHNVNIQEGPMRQKS